MVVNRPVAGVRNPVLSTSISSFLRAKDGGTFAAQPIPVNHILRSTRGTTSEPGSAAGGGNHISE
jgi:hypothetical protein